MINYYSIGVIAFALATLYLIRRDMTGFNHERRAGLWRVDDLTTKQEVME